jgi:hypothetical protein
MRKPTFLCCLLASRESGARARLLVPLRWVPSILVRADPGEGRSEPVNACRPAAYAAWLRFWRFEGGQGGAGELSCEEVANRNRAVPQAPAYEELPKSRRHADRRSRLWEP